VKKQGCDMVRGIRDHRLTFRITGHRIGIRDPGIGIRDPGIVIDGKNQMDQEDFGLRIKILKLKLPRTVSRPKQMVKSHTIKAVPNIWIIFTRYGDYQWCAGFGFCSWSLTKNLGLMEEVMCSALFCLLYLLDQLHVNLSMLPTGSTPHLHKRKTTKT